VCALAKSKVERRYEAQAIYIEAVRLAHDAHDVEIRSASKKYHNAAKAAAQKRDAELQAIFNDGDSK